MSLPLVEVEEYGVRFATGEPVTFPFARNTEKAPPPGPGDRFQQILEPGGLYLLHPGPNYRAAPGWEQGVVELEQPLVMLFNRHGGTYDDASWKAELARHYGVTGPELSEKLLAEGYDAVVTVTQSRGRNRPAATREIVVLDPARVQRANPQLKRKLMR